jgi:uncharacterized membrane protein
MTPTEFINRFFTAIFETHPIHSMTVHFPIALTAAALLFLVLALWRRSEGLERAAFYNITLAAVSAVIAALTGVRDNLVRFEGEAPLAEVKIFLGVTLIVLLAVIVFSRWRKPDILWTPATMILYLLGFTGSFALAATLGFLGGVILYGF